MRILARCPFSITALALAVVAVVPTSNAEAKLEEIIVTAQKREQNLQDVPISVAVISGEQLALRNENEIAALAKMSPGFTFKDGSSDNDRALQIRGVGTQSFSRGVDQSVSVVVDGVIATSAATALLDLSDIQRVEVLRGPQGMLFGKNASAGVLNVVTAKPTQDFAMKLGASYGSGNEIKTHGFISAGLSEKIAARLSFYSNDRDGFIKNNSAQGPDYNDRDEWGARVKFDIDVTDNLSALLSYSHSERDHQCCAFLVETNRVLPNNLFAYTLETPASKKEDRTLDPSSNIGKTEIDTSIVELNYSLGDHTLTSITAYTDSELVSDFRSFGFSRPLLFSNLGNDDITQFTQEFRLTSPGGENLDYQIGLYFFDKNLSGSSLQILDLFALESAFAPAPGFVFRGFDQSREVNSKSYAAFGQATWHVTDTTRITAGARYNYDDVELELDVVTPVLPAPAVVVPGATSGAVKAQRSDNAVSWRFIVEHDIAEDVLLYGSIARGYKGPGANTLSSVVDAVATGVDAIVDPEIPTNYELGVKSQWLDGRVTINGTVFYTEVEDFQATVSSSRPGELPNFNLSNVDKLITKGAELEISAGISENLIVAANLAYIDSTFDSFASAQCYSEQTVAQGCINGQQDLSGGDTTNSPDWSYGLSARYSQSFSGVPGEAYVLASYYWQDEVQYSASNNPITIGDDYGVMDLTLGFESDQGYELQFFVKNLFNEFHVSGVADLSGLFPSIKTVHNLDYTYKRRIGVSASYRF